MTPLSLEPATIIKPCPAQRVRLPLRVSASDETWEAREQCTSKHRPSPRVRQRNAATATQNGHRASAPPAVPGRGSAQVPPLPGPPRTAAASAAARLPCAARWRPRPDHRAPGLVRSGEGESRRVTARGCPRRLGQVSERRERGEPGEGCRQRDDHTGTRSPEPRPAGRGRGAGPGPTVKTFVADIFDSKELRPDWGAGNLAGEKRKTKCTGQ